METITFLRQLTQGLLQKIVEFAAANNANGTEEHQAPSPLNEFLKERKSKFLADLGHNDTKGWCVVTGNEAGDLDSIASAIGYAFLSSNERAIPLLQTDRSSLHLRPENMLALSLASLDAALLLTTSDIENGIQTYSLTYALVDHNKILSSCNGSVSAIIDHHEDEGHHKEADPRTIQPVGSCASLVTLHFKERWLEGSPEQLSDVAILLLSAILIDTGGLKAGGKATDADFEAARLLVPHTGMASASSITGNKKGIPSPLEALSRKLSETKSSVGHLSTKDLLRRDYKEYAVGGHRVGLSTVPVGLKFLVKRDIQGFWNDVDSWMVDQKLDILGVLTTYRSTSKKKHRRQLLFLVQSGKEEIEEKLFGGIAQDKELACEERRIAGLGERRGRCWRQGNVKATRKTVAPLIRRILEEPTSAKVIV